MCKSFSGYWHTGDSETWVLCSSCCLCAHDYTLSRAEVWTLTDADEPRWRKLLTTEFTNFFTCKLWIMAYDVHALNTFALILYEVSAPGYLFACKITYMCKVWPTFRCFVFDPTFLFRHSFESTCFQYVLIVNALCFS